MVVGCGAGLMKMVTEVATKEIRGSSKNHDGTSSAAENR